MYMSRMLFLGMCPSFLSKPCVPNTRVTRCQVPPKTSDLQQTLHVHVAYAVPWEVPEFPEQVLRAEHLFDKMSGCETLAEDNFR